MSMIHSLGRCRKRTAAAPQQRQYTTSSNVWRKRGGRPNPKCATNQGLPQTFNKAYTYYIL